MMRRHALPATLLTLAVSATTLVSAEAAGPDTRSADGPVTRQNLPTRAEARSMFPGQQVTVDKPERVRTFDVLDPTDCESSVSRPAPGRSLGWNTGGKIPDTFSVVIWQGTGESTDPNPTLAMLRRVSSQSVTVQRAPSVAAARELLADTRASIRACPTKESYGERSTLRTIRVTARAQERFGYSERYSVPGFRTRHTTAVYRKGRTLVTVTTSNFTGKPTKPSKMLVRMALRRAC